MKSLYHHDYDKDYPYFDMWKEYITKYLNEAKNFELHIWNEEEDIISLALKYGSFKDDPWRYGKIIKGEITDEFVNMILSTAEESYDGIFHKMTPFFGIFLDDIFQSAHYGTEIHYIPENALLVNYYSKITGTLEDIPPYEIVLRTENYKTIIEEYEGGKDKPVRKYAVPHEVHEKCIGICLEGRLGEWEDLEEYISLCGGMQVVKFCDGEKYIRASTDKMPENGAKVLDGIREILHKYMTEENLISE